MLIINKSEYTRSYTTNKINFISSSSSIDLIKIQCNHQDILSLKYTPMIPFKKKKKSFGYKESLKTLHAFWKLSTAW